MEANGVVLAKSYFVTFAIHGINSIERAVLNGSVQAVGAESALQFVVRHEVGRKADIIGAFHQSNSLDADRHVLRAQLNRGCQQETGSTATARRNANMPLLCLKS